MSGTSGHGAGGLISPSSIVCTATSWYQSWYDIRRCNDVNQQPPSRVDFMFRISDRPTWMSMNSTRLTYRSSTWATCSSSAIKPTWRAYSKSTTVQSKTSLRYALLFYAHSTAQHSTAQHQVLQQMGTLYWDSNPRLCHSVAGILTISLSRNLPDLKIVVVIVSLWLQKYLSTHNWLCAFVVFVKATAW